jgi:hypothetical protein
MVARFVLGRNRTASVVKPSPHLPLCTDSRPSAHLVRVVNAAGKREERTRLRRGAKTWQSCSRWQPRCRLAPLGGRPRDRNPFWRKATPLPLARSEVASSVTRARVFVIGGVNDDRGSSGRGGCLTTHHWIVGAGCRTCLSRVASTSSSTTQDIGSRWVTSDTSVWRPLSRGNNRSRRCWLSTTAHSANPTPGEVDSRLRSTLML